MIPDMSLVPKREYLLLFAGDVLVFVLSLWFTLAVRYFEFPSRELFVKHLVPFSLLFARVGSRLFPRFTLRQAHTPFQKPPFLDAPLDADSQRLSRGTLFLFHTRLRPFAEDHPRPLSHHLIPARLSLARRALPENASPAPGANRGASSSRRAPMRSRSRRR